MITNKQLKRHKQRALARLIVQLLGIVVISIVIIKVILKYYNSPTVLIFGIVVLWIVIIKVILNHLKMNSFFEREKNVKRKV